MRRTGGGSETGVTATEAGRHLTRACSSRVGVVCGAFEGDRGAFAERSLAWILGSPDVFGGSFSPSSPSPVRQGCTADATKVVGGEEGTGALPLEVGSSRSLSAGCGLRVAPARAPSCPPALAQGGAPRLPPGLAA